MTEPLNRDDIIKLLDKLGADKDEDVLEAARQAHARIAEAGVTWDDLLVSDRTDEPDDTGDDEFLDLEEETVKAPARKTAKTGNDAASRKLIDKLLARKGISADLREELRGYKSDIAEGEFSEADRQYLDALHGRLTKKS